MTKIKIVLITLFFLAVPCLAGNDVAITVNGDRIYRDEFNYALSRYEDSYKRYFGADISDSEKEKMKEDVANDLVERQLYIQEGLRRGIKAKVYAPEEEIEELVMANPAFYMDGKFSEDSYKKFNTEASHESKRITDRAEEIILAQKVREVLPSKVIASIKDDVSIDDKEVLDEYLKRAERVKARYIKLDPVDIANKTFITEDQIKEYYQKHKSDYTVPASKKVAELFFDPDDYASMVDVSDQMLEDYYGEHKNEFRSDKLVKVKYVLFRSKEYARGIYDLGVNLRQYYDENLDKFLEPSEARIRVISVKKPVEFSRMIALEDDLRQAVPFDEMAKKYSDDPATAFNGGDLGVMKEGTLKEPLNSVAFGLQDGKVSGLIETDNGYYVVTVSEKKEQRVKPFMEVKDALEETFAAEKAMPIAAGEAKRFRNEARKVGFEAAAQNKRKTVYETDFLRTLDRIPVIGKNNQFTRIAFNASTAEVAGIAEYDEGYCVLKVADIKPQEYLPLADVSDSVRNRIIKENSYAFAFAAAKHAQNLLEEKLPLSEIEKRVNMHISVSEVPSASGTEEDIGRIVQKEDGYYLRVVLNDIPPHVAQLNDVYKEVTIKAALENADKIAQEKAQELLASGAVTTDAAVESAPFFRTDYLIGTEYMKPFIEQCFTLKLKEPTIITSLNKYYVVKVVERGINLAGYSDESPMVKSQVLKEKRESHLKDWLNKERERSVIQVNI